MEWLFFELYFDVRDGAIALCSKKLWVVKKPSPTLKGQIVLLFP